MKVIFSILLIYFTCFDNVNPNLLAKKSGDPWRDVDCIECKAVVSFINQNIEAGTSVEEMLVIAAATCKTSGLASPDVCDGMVQLAGPEVIYVVNNTIYDANTVCGFLLGGSHCKTNNLPAWNVTIPGGKPAPDHPEPPMPATPFRILHLSDVHVDLEYVVGAPDECHHPLCCRDWGDEPVNKSVPAGYWGSKGECDVPIRTFDALLAAAALQKPDIVYVAGDLPAHDVWIQSHSSILNSIDIVTNSIKAAFPSTPVVMALGNHESAPVNSFNIPAAYDSGYTMDWLYTHIADIWSEWIPADKLSTLEEGGFYEFSPFAGLRVISLNMNFCNNQNWWLLLDHEDPVGEMEWLVDVLTEAELNGEKAHLIGHIAPGQGSCESSYSQVFNTIISRFESTITGQFYGHSHRDSWEVFWDVDDNTRPVSVGFIPGSVTSGGEKNPTFKIFSVDGDATWTLLDLDSWSMNLTIANEDEVTPPSFAVYYNALSSFQISGLSPQSMADLTYDMTTDDDLFDQYLIHRYNFYAIPHQLEDCDDNCRKSELCSLATSNTLDNEPCDRIKAMVDAANNVTI